MHKSFIDKLHQLNASTEAYAMATVVHRTAPSSGKPGDQAIITEDGKIFGWVGGGCTLGIVLKEALLSIQNGKPRLIHIGSEEPKDTTCTTKHYAMTCQSQGSLDVFIQPTLPNPHLYIFGRSSIGRALAMVAGLIDYRITIVNDNPDKVDFPHASELIDIKDFNASEATENSYVVICTQGQGDENALKKALSMNSKYISFVSSRIKANAVFSELRKDGIDVQQLKKIRTPAGLDINAKLPNEVAISILAEIIDHLRKPMTEEPTADLTFDDNLYYLNPVCNIPIEKSTAKHILTYEQESVYFCCDGCKVKFEQAPENYIN